MTSLLRESSNISSNRRTVSSCFLISAILIRHGAVPMERACSILQLSSGMSARARIESEP